MDNAMSDNRTVNVLQFDWRWLVVTYCFLVLFHLVPSLLLSSLWQFFFGKGIWRIAWWVWGGMALVGTYVGYRSISTTIVGPGLASMLYMTTVILTMSDIRDVHASGSRLIGLLVALHLIAFLVGCFGGGLGGWLQSRRRNNRHIAENVDSEK